MGTNHEQYRNNSGTHPEQSRNFHSNFVPDPHPLRAPVTQPVSMMCFEVACQTQNFDRLGSRYCKPNLKFCLLETLKPKLPAACTMGSRLGTHEWLMRAATWRQLYKNRSSRKIDSQRLCSREQDFPKTFSLTDNQFFGKTHFYTIRPWRQLYKNRSSRKTDSQ